MKNKIKVMIMLLLVFNLNAFSLDKEYVSQMDSKIDPKVMCFPSAMINSAIYLDIDLPKKESKYENIVDIYDEYIHSNTVSFWVNCYAPAYIRNILYSPKYDNDMREIWQIEECAFNSFIGYKACKLHINRDFEEIENSIINYKSAIVISGIFSGRKHCVTLINIDKENNTVTFIDSFGNPYDNYINNAKFQIVNMDLLTFKRKVIQDTNKYTYIEFRKDFPNSLANIKTNKTCDNITHLDYLDKKNNGLVSHNLFDLYETYIKDALDKNTLYSLSYDSFETYMNDISELYNIEQYKLLTPLLMHSSIDVSLEYLTVLYILHEDINLDISNTDNIIKSFYSAEGNIENALRIYVDGYERYLFLRDSDLSNNVAKYYKDLYLENIKDENLFYCKTTSFYDNYFDLNTLFDTKHAVKISGLKLGFNNILYSGIVCIPQKKEIEEERISEIGKSYYINEIGNFVINF